MLGDAKIVAFVATRDPERAKAFYRDVIGLRLVADEPYALVFDANGTMLRLQKVKETMVAPFTVLGWSVPDIAATVHELSRRGVAFERYPGLEQDRDAIWSGPAGARIAWLKDPDGNTLSLTQF